VNTTFKCPCSSFIVNLDNNKCKASAYINDDISSVMNMAESLILIHITRIFTHLENTACVNAVHMQFPSDNGVRFLFLKSLLIAVAYLRIYMFLYCQASFVLGGFKVNHSSY